jgi:hypothetical protein
VVIVDQLSMVDGISQKLRDKNRAYIQLGADKAGPAKPGSPAAPASATKPAVKPAS